MIESKYVAYYALMTGGRQTGQLGQSALPLHPSRSDWIWNAVCGASCLRVGAKRCTR